MQKIMDGNEACSYVTYNFTELAGIYPITPSSPSSELLDEWSNEGKTNFWGDRVKVVQMQSEAGAIATVHGALMNGVMATTFTSSQGLLLMIPNMYKIAGELLPCVINVASRTVASHALSILGDHQDIYAIRSTGFAILANSSVQQVMDLTSVSFLSTIKGKIPFVNFYDGFRTSHELQKITLMDMKKIYPLIDKDKLTEFKNRALSINNVTKGSNINDDLFFQISEARNKYYDELPDIVNNYMKEINKITGKDYKPFNYYGAKDATKIIIAMGSVCGTIKETIDALSKTEKVGLIEVHLYRPFSSKYFLDVLPKTVKNIAVLERTKENGASEPLYLDVLNVLKNHDIKIIGGRYGISGKNTDIDDINAVYQFLDKKDNFTGFTIGIKDDVTNLSLEPVKLERPKTNCEILIYGFGSDGMVSASKELIKIIGDNTKAFVQGYSEYDSKKSGGVTRSHIRLGNKEIREEFYIKNPSVLVCTKDTYIEKYNMLDSIREEALFILNTSKTKDEIINTLSNRDINILKERNIKFYLVDASTIAIEEGLSGKINTIVLSVIFKLAKLINYEFAIDKIKEFISISFANKGQEIIEKNLKAIDRALETLVKVELKELKEKKTKDKESKDVFDLIVKREGYNIPVSKLLDFVDGTYKGGQSHKESRDITEVLPSYDFNNCIMCNMCSFVCPHGVIRPYLLDEKEVENAPKSLKGKLKDALIKDHNYKFVIGVNMDKCTGCGVCSETCPGKAGNKALVMEKVKDVKTKTSLEEIDYLLEHVSKKEVMDTNTIKGSQFVEPKFKYSGACAGCGETPYLRLLTQLFGNELVIANATGCSSIYGGSIPQTAYEVPWANSLFEDNAEFAYGISISDKLHKERIKELIKDNLKKIPKKYKNIVTNYYKDINYINSIEFYNVVDKLKIKELSALKEFIKTKSIWAIGGDGWAYDIGFGGLDHVMANNENVNILVLDTEVYSNTGGQKSKSTNIGSVCKFASKGNEIAKKDLAKIALTYPNTYVGTISMGANMMHTIKTLKEAKEHNGPSIIIAYSPCIAQGLKNGMVSSIKEEKSATESGYFPLFRRNPVTKEFNMDSKADFDKYFDFLEGERRYSSLSKINKDKKLEFYEENKKNAMDRYEYLEGLKKEE